MKYFKTEGDTNILLYSTNEGLTWKSHKFYPTPIRWVFWQIFFFPFHRIHPLSNVHLLPLYFYYFPRIHHLSNVHPLPFNSITPGMFQEFTTFLMSIPFNYIIFFLEFTPFQMSITFNSIIFPEFIPFQMSIPFNSIIFPEFIPFQMSIPFNSIIFPEFTTFLKSVSFLLTTIVTIFSPYTFFVLVFCERKKDFNFSEYFFSWI